MRSLMSVRRSAVGESLFVRWLVAMALFFGVTAQLLGSAAYAEELGAQFVSVTPVRFVDTNNGTGGSSSPLGAAATRSYTVPGLPSNATAVLLDVAATSATGDSSLRIWPYGESMPSGTSVLAIESTQLPDSNSVIVPLGTNGKISVWNGNGSVDFNLDLHGYFVPSDGTAGFHALTAERIVDSPAGLGVTGPTIIAGTAYDIQVTGDTVPEGATAIFANIKISSATAEGGLRVAKGGASLSGMPSALNFDAGVTTDSGITIPLSSAGKLRLASTAASGTVKIYIDVQGYFAPGDDGADFHVGSQQLLADNLTIAGGADKTITAAGSGGLPSDGSVGSVALTLFVSNWSASGGVSVANPDDGASDLSNVSFATSMDAGVGANSTAVVPVSEAGKLLISNKSANAVKLRLTVQGWFDNPDGAEGLVEPPTATAYAGIDSYVLDDLSLIAQERGISVQAAVDDYLWKEAFSEAVDTIQANNPDTFSSADVDPGGSANPVIRFAGEAPEDIESAFDGFPSNKTVEIDESAPYTAAELASIQQIADDAATAEVGTSGDAAATSVDAQTGDVLTEVSHFGAPVQTDTNDLKETVEDALSSDLPNAEMPEVDVQTTVPNGEFTTLRGGARIAQEEDWSDGDWCTSGFPVRLKSDKKNKRRMGLVTARHCFNDLYYYADRESLRDASKWLDPKYGDIQFFETNGNEGTGTSFYADKKGRSNALRVITGVKKVKAHNDVCMYGRARGVRFCGEVLGVGEPFTALNPETGKYWTVKNMIRVQMDNEKCPIKGDSGGPVFDGSKAVGLISGCETRDDDGDHKIDIALAYVSQISAISERMGLELNY